MNKGEIDRYAEKYKKRMAIHPKETHIKRRLKRKNISGTSLKK